MTNSTMSKYTIIISVIAVLVVGWLVYLKYGQVPATKNENTAKVSQQIFETPSSSAPALTAHSIQQVASPATTSLIKTNTMPVVKIQTNKGDITIELFADDAPKTVENFLTLVKKGFYDGVIFHRVISGFMIQGGDPTGTGTGGPGYQFADELDPKTASYQRGYVRGTVAMANSGPNTNGSQFFIMHQDYPLPHAYTIFGRVTSGIEVVDAIAASQTDSSDRPLTDVVMTKVVAE